MADIEELLENNGRYAEDFTALATVVPTMRLAIVTCMDSRIDVFASLGLELGDAHVIRNAGGIVTDDVIRSLAISQRLLNTQAILVAHHSECGMLGFDEQAFAAALEADAGVAPDWSAGGFSDLDEDVRESVRRLRDSPYLLHTDEIRGFVLEVTTGRLREVDLGSSH
jgi:carbonic anhydrase